MSQVNHFFISKAMYILVRGHPPIPSIFPVLIISTDLSHEKSVPPLLYLPHCLLFPVTEDQTQLVKDRLKLNWTSKLQQHQ